LPYRRAGQPERLSTTVRDIAGVLADPGDIMLRLRDPARLVTTVDYNPGPIVRDGVGQFHYDLSGLSTLGSYSYVWKTTGANQGQTPNPKSFTLVDEFTPILLTMDEAKSQLQITGTPDSDLERYIDSASDEVEMSVGQPVIPRIVTREAAVMSDGRLLLPHMYIVPGSITAATQNGTVVNVAAWQASDTAAGPGTGGTISGVTAPWGTVLVTYQPGFDPIPEPLREAAALRAQHKMETQRGAAELPLSDVIEGGGSTFALLLRARDLEARYRIPAVA
jgi:hypothetical protein